MEKKFKSDVGEIVFWSSFPGLTKACPVQRGIKFLPDYLKNMPQIVDTPDPFVNIKTLKTCPGIFDLFKNTYVVPLWCDLQLEIQEDGEWRCGAKVPSSLSNSGWDKNLGQPTEQWQLFASHDDRAFKNWIPEPMKSETSLVFKTNIPWRCKTPPGVSVLQIPLTYNFNPHFTTLPGIIDTDVYYNLNPQMLIHKTGHMIWKRGTPLAAYMPFRREEFNLDVRDETSEDRLIQKECELQVETQFRHGYRDLPREKCPFQKEMDFKLE